MKCLKAILIIFIFSSTVYASEFLTDAFEKLTKLQLKVSSIKTVEIVIRLVTISYFKKINHKFLDLSKIIKINAIEEEFVIGIDLKKLIYA